jgi:hypothetical protein
VTCTRSNWFSPGTPVSSINIKDRHDITEILLKVALYTKNSKPFIIVGQEKLEYTKRLTIHHNSEKDRPYNGLKKKQDRQYNGLKVSSTPHLNGIQTHVSGVRHWLHR